MCVYTCMGCQAPDKEQLQECISELVRVDKDWIPAGDGFSLYLRPTAIACVGTDCPLPLREDVVM